MEESKNEPHQKLNASSTLLPYDKNDGTLKYKPNYNKNNASLKSIKGYIFGIMYVLFDCFSYIFAKMAPSFTGFHNGVMRYLIQLTIMSFILYQNQLNIFGDKKDRKILLLRGFTGSAALILGYLSLQFIEVSDTQTLINSCVVITAILGRVFLKEKINLCHIVSLIFTITGVLCILRPSFLFGFEESLESYFHENITMHNLNVTRYKNDIYTENSGKIFGVILVLINAFFLSISQVTSRSLITSDVHHSVISMYANFFGLPISLIGVLVILLMNNQENPFSNLVSIDYMYSFFAGLVGTVGLISLNVALKYEDAAKIGMLRITGVLFSMIFQYFLLDIEVDFLGILGAISIIIGTLMIILIKLYGQSILNSKNFYRIVAVEF